MRTSTHIDLNGATKAHYNDARGTVCIQDYPDTMLFVGFTPDTSPEGVVTALTSVIAALTEQLEATAAAIADAAELAEVG